MGWHRPIAEVEWRARADRALAAAVAARDQAAAPKPKCETRPDKGYTRGCKCPVCRAKGREWNRTSRERNLDTRRVQDAERARQSRARRRELSTRITESQ